MEQTPQASDFLPPAPPEQPWERPEPEWYKDAVFYEVLVRAFYDPDDTGSGTLKGLEEKLDYLQWLGVDCLWLPPFYDSPLRDGGYDIRDFRKVLPEFGTVEDFISLIDSAHKRGIRIITDFPINHTSDTHAWFQASRQDPDGAYGDYYVWSDDDTKYDGTRIIFIDTEESNWTWDPVRKQYYWHRFFSHQPDLNYDNPAVQEEILDIIRFWLDLGMDGIRLDAIPYLFEREGTSSENLQETHGFIKRVRTLFDEEYPGRFLLAEANQMPDEVVAYFGNGGPDGVGDECQMAFHFPVMPRIFMGIHQESAQPIIDILRETPAIPATAQWGIFLRNHDELTLEMVSEEERDYMYKHYAYDPRMRANVGIRRRLAAGRPPRPLGARPRPAVEPAGFAVFVLRRRDRHGRQHLAARPRRRAHPDAVVQRPQRRLFQGGAGAPLPAAGAQRPVRLPHHQRGIANEPRELAAAVGAQAGAHPQAVQGVRPRLLH